MRGPGDWDGATYDRIAHPQARWGRAVLDLLELAGDQRVLDAGCGSGRVTEQLLDRFPGISVVALDAAPSMLAEARVRLARFGDRVDFVEADLSQPLPVEVPLDVPVDVIVSTAAFHWVLDHDRLFAHLAGALRPGGRLVAQCGGAGNIASVVAAVAAVGPSFGGVDVPSPWLFATPAEAVSRLQRAGFIDADAWLHDEHTPFDSPDALRRFLAIVVLRSHLDRLPEVDRRPFLDAVTRLLPGTALDYVRLTMVAGRASSESRREDSSPP
jgi:trans-aconitate 2-methyltransferase